MILRRFIKGFIDINFFCELCRPRRSDICLQSRHGDTPVLIARQVGRENQTKKFFTLNTIPFKEIDMLSIIIIGNSQTTLVDEIFLTPRGYLQN